MRTGVWVRRGSSCWEFRPAPSQQMGPSGSPTPRCIRATRQENPGLASPHFLLAGFSLFSPPFELLKGNLPFQVVDELRTETRHVCGVQLYSTRNRGREPEKQDFILLRGAERSDTAFSWKTGPAGAAAAALGFRGSIWSGFLPGDASGIFWAESGSPGLACGAGLDLLFKMTGELKNKKKL